jgi:hypothetical protein
VSAAFWAVVEPPWSFSWHRPDDQVAVGGALGEATLPQGVLVAWVVVLGTLIPFALLLSGAPRAPRRARHAALAVGAAGRRDRRLGVALGAPERHPGGGAALVLAGILIAEARQPLHIPD